MIWCASLDQEQVSVRILGESKLNGFIKKIVIICFLLLSSIAYAAEEDPIFLGEAPKIPRFQRGQSSFRENINEETKKTFIKNFYNKYIDEEPTIVKRYKSEQVHVKLDDCISMALYNNFKIKISNAQESQYRWIFNNKTSKFLPNFYYLYSLNNLNGAFLAGGVIPTLVNETAVQDNFWVTMNLFDGGYRFFQRKAAKSRYDAAKKDVIFTREEVLKDVAISYYRLLAFKLSLRALLRNKEEIEMHLEINKKNGSEFDILRSEAALAAAKQKLALKYSEFRKEQANLSNIMGIDVEETIFPSEEVIIKKTLVDKELNIEDLSQAAYISRNDLEVMRQKIKVLENEKKSIYSNFIPHADGYASMGRVGTARLGLTSSKQVGFFANVPLGPFVSEYTELKKYDSMIDEAKYNLQNRYRDIQQNIINSYYSTRSSSMRAVDAEEQIITSDKALEEALLRLMSKGLYVDVLQTQDSKTDAKLNLINAIADYNVAQVNQLFNMGAISIYNLTEATERDLVQEELDAKLEK